ncbi:hypothetical protein [Luteimonas sp. 3794]|uniref:hypothetical protein n=1 Tax=Luteimonas sp. 3794 TaxID=2817730 RepID=UPI0028567A4F|nr:hypothetical protein [Luteimonas sp. 3794]MDR6990623.1 hypothetical protein [Luteimonas sp. 3794]
MSVLLRLVAILQIAGGFYGLASTLASGGAGGGAVLVLVIGLLLSTFAMIAGVLLLEGDALGERLSRIALALQIPVIATPWLSYAWHAGATVPLQFRFGRHVVLDLDWSVPSEAFRLALAGPSTAILGVNLLALGLWLVMRFARR